LDYISSAGLRVIKVIHMGMKKKDGELVLTNVQKMVMEVFEMVGFAGLLKFR
jgi:anti-anti-sigma factor